MSPWGSDCIFILVWRGSVGDRTDARKEPHVQSLRILQVLDHYSWNVACHWHSCHTQAAPSARTQVWTMLSYKTNHPVGIEHDMTRTGSFLLIVRTGRIFTTHIPTLKDGCDTNEYRRILGCSSIQWGFLTARY